jgi:hypothetical protein
MIPVILKDFIDRVNASGGKGLPGLVAHFALFDRAGKLAADPQFLQKLEELVEEHEPQADRERDPRGWMQEALSAFLGFLVEVPEPPKLNRKQTRALKKYGFIMVFIPAIGEAQYPEHAVKPAWSQYLNEQEIERIPLAGRWVAIETIRKPDWQEKAYPDDRLIADIGLKSRFANPFDGEKEGDDIVTDLLPKIAQRVGFGRESVMVTSAEEWNFVANLFNWLREVRGEVLPDLGSTDSWEWSRNSFGSELRLIVGHRESGGLRSVSRDWADRHGGNLGFRVLVVL